MTKKFYIDADALAGVTDHNVSKRVSDLVKESLPEYFTDDVRAGMNKVVVTISHVAADGNFEGEEDENEFTDDDGNSETDEAGSAGVDGSQGQDGETSFDGEGQQQGDTSQSDTAKDGSASDEGKDLTIPADDDPFNEHPRAKRETLTLKK